MTIAITCQHCGQAFEDDAALDTTLCPHCGHETSVTPDPAQPAETSATAPIAERQVAAAAPIFTPERMAYVWPSLRLAGWLVICALLALIWRQMVLNGAPPTWQVETFIFEPGQIYEVKQIHYRWDGVQNQAYPSTGWQVIRPSGVLDALAAEGWQFVWTDGREWVMQRPNGKWYYQDFRVTEVIPAK